MTTARFALPLLHAGQAQKELFHNEALTQIDALLHPAVKGVAAEPSVSPEAGDAWIVDAGATGGWAGMANHIASWTEGGWRFAAPREGMAVWSEELSLSARYVDGAWRLGVLSAARVEIGGVQVLGGRVAPIATPTGGTVVDSEARNAVNAMLAALQAHGLIG